MARLAAPQDVQATLAALTAHSAAQTVHDYAADARQLIVCGGGACNGHLMGMLQQPCPTARCWTPAALGLPPLQVEATAFAWLARQTIRGEPGSLPAQRAPEAPVCWVGFIWLMGAPQAVRCQGAKKTTIRTRRCCWRWGS